jgi:hypothetical protein
MAAAYGGPGETPMLQYTATAAFDFTTPNREALDLDLKLPPISFAGIGFDSLELQVAVVGGSTLTKNFSSLTAAEAFFTGPSVGLGTVAAGSQSVSLTYDLTYNPGTLAQAGDGFGFTYDIRDPPATAFDFAAASPIAGIPEPSTWTMMLVGFAVLASAGLRRRKPSMTVCGPGQDGRAD